MMAQKTIFNIAVASALMVASNAAAQQEIGNVTWSPDGKKLAFYATWDGGDRDIYVINTDGTGLVQLTANDAFDGAPSFSRDGKYVLFQSDIEGTFDLFRALVSGGDVEKIYGDADADEVYAREISGGRIGFRRGAPPHGVSVENGLFALDPKTGNVEKIIDTEENELWYAWPKKGDRFFLTLKDSNGKYGIYSAKLDGSDLRPLTSFPRSDDTKRSSYVLNFDDAGRQIAIWSNETDEVDFRYIHVHDVKTDKDIRLPKYERFTTLPNISPDGRQIAFAGATNNGTRWRIYIQDIDDGSLRQVWPKYPE